MSLAENAAADLDGHAWTERFISRGYVRTEGGTFSEALATATEVTLGTVPERVELVIPDVSGVVEAVRLDFSDRPVSFRLHALRVMTGEATLYAWSGAAAELARAADLDIRSGARATALLHIRAPTAALVVDIPPAEVSGEVRLVFEAALIAPESALAEALSELRRDGEVQPEDVVQDMLARIRRARSEVERALGAGRRALEDAGSASALDDAAGVRAAEARLDAALRRLEHSEEVVLSLLASAEQRLSNGEQALRESRRVQFEALTRAVERLLEELPARYASASEDLQAQMGSGFADLGSQTTAVVSTMEAQRAWVEQAQAVLSRLEAQQQAAASAVLEQQNIAAHAAQERERATEQIIIGRLGALGGRLEAGLNGVEQLLRAQALQLQAEQQDWLKLQLPRAVEAVVGRITAELRMLEPAAPAPPPAASAEPGERERELELERSVEELQRRVAEQEQELTELRAPRAPGGARSLRGLAGRRS